ncbi:MAG TPA: RNA 2',3'-cyclic phosphodiesterase [Nitrospira sp.]|nr:RNA 2',3'-cyclic phosphodiesterase [Nitrospira sp.]
MIRAFLAVQLSEPLRATLAALQSEVKRRIIHDLRREVSLSWVRPASMHLTVKFLGDIPDDLVIPLREAVAAALKGHHVLHIPLDRLGVFPALQQPRVLWIGPTEQWEASGDAGRLAAIHQAIEACCSALNLAPDTRPLSAHLTLARIKTGHRAAGQTLARSGVMDRLPSTVGSLAVERITLMRSELKPTGSVYTALWEAELQPG